MTRLNSKKILILVMLLLSFSIMISGCHASVGIENSGHPESITQESNADTSILYSLDIGMIDILHAEDHNFEFVQTLYSELFEELAETEAAYAIHYMTLDVNNDGEEEAIVYVESAIYTGSSGRYCQ